jgi:hypothetical protein
MVCTTEVWYLEGTALFLSPHFRSGCDKLPTLYAVYAAGTFAGLAPSEWAMQRTTVIKNTLTCTSPSLYVLFVRFN